MEQNREVIKIVTVQCGLRHEHAMNTGSLR
jgi:hypothetical protein